MHPFESLAFLDERRQSGDSAALDSLLEQRAIRDDPNLVLDLCSADLEWNWRLQKSESPPTKECCSEYGTGIEKYLARLNAICAASNQNFKFQLIECCWLSESKWGTPPAISEYQNRYELAPLECEQLVGGLNEVSYWGYLADPLSLVTEFQRINCGAFTAGRQRKHDSAPLSFCKLSQRLIVATVHDKHISREQLRISRIALNQVHVRNIGKSACRFTSEAKLKPGESNVFEMPFCFAANRNMVTICEDAGNLLA